MTQLRQPLAMMALAAAATAAFCCCYSASTKFDFHEATVDAIQLAFENGSLTSSTLVLFYLDRIARLNPLLHAVIEVNPDALHQAARADADRAAGHHYCGPLHGVPVLLKDNIATRDGLNTTAGSLALLGAVARRDAGVVAQLRRAGAVVLGKANLPEWANFRSSPPGLRGWSAPGDQARNPYVLSADPCRSSTGPAIAAVANMAAVTLGTETTASILCPAAANSVVGIKPTVGLTSRSGVIPFTARQDTVGQHGAVVIENLEIANLSIINDGAKSGLLTALLAEFKLNLNNYLTDLSYSPVHSLAEIIEFNNAHPVEEKLKEFGQSILLMSENTTGIGPAEKAAIRRLNELSMNGVEKLMNDHQLDAIVAPDSAAAVILAFRGLPGVVVPAGYDEQGIPFGVCFGGLQGYEPRLIEMAYAFEQVTKVRRPPAFRT